MTTGHVCAKVDCEEDATHVVIESQPLAMLFESGAGLLCARHAGDFAVVGGLRCSVNGFVMAASAEKDAAIYD